MQKIAKRFHCHALIAVFISLVAFPVSSGQSKPARRSVPVHYDSTLSLAGFPNPLVRATIAGRQALFIVDTGAGVHVLAAWFAKAAGLALRDSSTTLQGSTGEKSHTQTATNVEGVFEDGTPLKIDEAAVVDLPPIFQEKQLAGLLSPQMLARPGEAAVLDLREPALNFDSTDEALAQLPPEAGQVPGGHVCVNPKSQFRNRLYGVQSLIEGVTGVLLLDTGATRTLVAPQSTFALKLSDRSVVVGRIEGVGGAATNGRRVMDVNLNLAGMNMKLDLSIGGAPGDCGTDGLLGMDVLKKCVIVLGDSKLGLYCGK